MIERKPIDMAAQPVFRRYIQNIDNSTYNFTNMFMWSGDGGFTYVETEGCLSIFFQHGKHPLSASYPVGDGDKKKAIKEIATYIESLELRPVFRNLSSDMVEELKELYPDCFEFIADRAAADYIYETEKMITLSGKKLHAKRNHYNYFKNTYAYTYKDLTKDDMGDCLALFDRWVDEKEDMKWMDGSREATVRLLENFDELPVRGGAIYVDGEMVSFSIGEPVSDDTALIHLEFAVDLRGAFNAMSKEFCEHAWKEFTYVNREEDMGLPGLRHAKLAYRPAKLLEKFNAVQVKPL